jgi:LuxR family transcriptional regulator of csgAB operon
MVCEMTDFSGQEIYLVGTNKLYNELLARCIADQAGVQCTVAAALCSVPHAKYGNDHKRLVLYDFSNNADSLEDLISSDTNNILHTDYLVLTNLSETSHIECEALQCGVRGFLYFQGGIDTLLEMINSVLNSEIWISRELMTKLLLEGGITKAPKEKEPQTILSPRELDILSGVIMGLTNKMIADYYCLSPHTVKTHIYHIFKKIQVGNRVQAAQWASQHQETDTNKVVSPASHSSATPPHLRIESHK